MLLDLVIFRKRAGLQFGVDELAVDAHLETSAIGRDERELLQAGLQFRDEFAGQTDRVGFVVSNLAVDDFDFHYRFSFTPRIRFRIFI